MSADTLRRPKRVQPRDDGVVTIPAFDIPLSEFMSREAKAAFVKRHRDYATMDLSTVTAARESVDKLLQPFLSAMWDRYPVEVLHTEIAGIPAASVTPATGIPERNQRRVLLNLHGGSFISGGGGIGGLVEAVPIAAVSGMKVITLDYRMSPEHRYPAATDDVELAYEKLLDEFDPASIGIYGCSAGAILTAQSVARFLARRLPLPGGIGLLAAGADPRYQGDSAYLMEVLDGSGVPSAASTSPLPLRDGYSEYLAEADLGDPAVSPVRSIEVLRQFPPTVLIAGTRGYEVGSIAYTHNLLVGAGVTAELHLWDGLWHAFHYDPGLPESRQAYDVVARFFDNVLR